MVECWLLIITGHSENNSAKANKEEQEQLKNNFVIAFMESLPLQRIKEILAVLSELIIEYSSIILDEKIKRKNAYYYKMYVAKKGAVRTLVQSINNLKNHQSHGL
jgi:Cft2 family RNA processing exonuclease